MSECEWNLNSHIEAVVTVFQKFVFADKLPHPRHKESLHNNLGESGYTSSSTAHVCLQSGLSDVSSSCYLLTQ